MFNFQNPRSMTTGSTYEDENIVASYCDDASEWCEDAVEKFAMSSPGSPPSKCSPKLASPDANSTKLRSPKRDRSSSLSSEATWLSRSFTTQDPSQCLGQLQAINMNEKRLAEKSRRCCHVVEGPTDPSPCWIGERKAVCIPQLLTSQLTSRPTQQSSSPGRRTESGSHARLATQSRCTDRASRRNPVLQARKVPRSPPSVPGTHRVIVEIVPGPALNAVCEKLLRWVISGIVTPTRRRGTRFHCANLLCFLSMETGRLRLSPHRQLPPR